MRLTEKNCPAWVAVGCPDLMYCLDAVEAVASPVEGTATIPIWKRALDIFCIILALPALLPLMLFLTALIKIVAPGPVFFRQERVGFLGKSFMILKVRTMKVNADTGVHQTHLKNLIHSDRPMVKMDMVGDPRLIKFGALLRSSGLDELPQLINVLRGEMSLVGPRPCTPYEFAQYLPWQRERFTTLPGLTGLWQVSGKNKTTFTQMMHLDIFYARNKSFWIDIKIMSKTISALTTQVKETQMQNKDAEQGRKNARVRFNQIGT